MSATRQMYQAWTSDELLYSTYGYQPVLSAPIIFVILYFLLFLLHLYQNFHYRQWWLTILTLGCIAEAVGNACRIYGHFHPFNADVYTAMQCILVLTPALFAAIDFAILGKLATLFPERYSLVNPRWIMPFFVALDFSSMAVQGGGAGVAASAQADGEDVDYGGNIVVVGLAIQVLGYVLFNTLLSVFVWRCVKDPPPEEVWNGKMKNFITATAVSSGLIFVRSVFRLIEMSVGWLGVIAKTEWCYYTFDAALVAVAVFIFNVYNPGEYLPGDFCWKRRGKGEKMLEEGGLDGQEKGLVEERLTVSPKDSIASEQTFRTDSSLTHSTQ